MGRERLRPLTNLAAFISAAFPRHATKEVGRALNLTPRQAWRVVATGKAPARIRGALLQVLDNAIADNEQRLKELRQELRLAEYAEQRAAAATATNMVGKVSAVAQADRRK